MEDDARSACARLFVAEGRSILLLRDEWHAEGRRVIENPSGPHSTVYACRLLRSAASTLDASDNAQGDDWELVSSLLEFVSLGARGPAPNDGMPLLAQAAAEMSYALPALLLAAWRQAESASAFAGVMACVRALCAVSSDAAPLDHASWAVSGQSHAGVAMRTLRLLELAAICCSRATEDTVLAIGDGQTDDQCTERSPDSVSLVDVPHGRGASALRPATVRDEGVRLAEVLVARVHELCMSVASATASPSAALAGASLLGHLVRVRPSFLPWVVPGLVALHEAFGASAERTSHERGFVRRTLDRELAALMDLSAAERFVPLLGSALTRAAPEDADLRALDAGDSADASLQPPAVAPTGAQSSAKGAAAPRTQSELSVAHVPLAATCEIVLRTLVRIDAQSLPAAIEAWRPSPPGVAPLSAGESAEAQHAAPLKKAAPETDPRRPRADAAAADEPYELVPRSLSARDAAEALRVALRSSLSAAGDLSGGASRAPKKARLRLLVRLCVVLDVLSSSPGTGAATVLDFCFGDLSSRAGLLLHWLRVLWVCDQQRAQTAGSATDGTSSADRVDDQAEESEQSYDDAYARTVARLSGMAGENVPAWDTSAARILAEAPELVGDAHEAMLRAALAAPPSRVAARELIEALARDRPAVRMSLLLAVLLPATGTGAGSDDGLRKAAVFAVSDAFAMLGDTSVNAAIDMHANILLSELSAGASGACTPATSAASLSTESLEHADVQDKEQSASEPSACVDLPLRLALRKPAVFARRFVGALVGASSETLEYALVQAGALAPVVRAPAALLVALAASASGDYASPSAEGVPAPDSLPALRLVRRLVDAMAKAGTLTPDALPTLWAQIRAACWPAALLETTAALASREDLLALPETASAASNSSFQKRTTEDAHPEAQPAAKRRRRDAAPAAEAPPAQSAAAEPTAHAASLVARYVAQVEPAAERPAVVAAYTVLAEKVGPADLLVLLHGLEGAVPLRRCLAAVQLCLAMPAVFRTEAVSSCMRTLLDRAGYAPGREDARARPRATARTHASAPLPTLFMRTLLEALRVYRGSFAPFALGVLRVLAEHDAAPRVWDSPTHWEGWLRCARVLLPSSAPLIAALPKTVLSSLRDTAPDIYSAASK